MISESVQGEPAPALRPFVAPYAGYRQVGVPPARHRGLPSPYLTLIITLDEPMQMAEHTDRRRPPGEYVTLIGGLHTIPAIISHDGRQSGVQLALKPLGARALLGLPACELTGVDTDAADVLGPLAVEMQERARAAATWPERFAVLDELLLRQLRDRQLRDGRLGNGQLRDGRAGSPEVTQAWRALLASGGTAAVPELAREAGWSPRRLHTRFRAEVGLAPKEAARVVRFDRARRLLQRRVQAAGQPELAALAAACGYYDQAHLAREFRALAGCPPSRWVAEEFRNVQARPGERQADSRS
ncbi:MAG TPA: helix-turn-helix domain-containing protein [Streptosporangiaceae bacterium]